ncbi:MAG: heimdallarchaeosortase, partial [Candidatus Hodarchaeales archaeon]
MTSDPPSNVVSTIQQETILHSKVDKKSEDITAVERKKPDVDEAWVIISFSLVCITSFLIYIAFDYSLIEKVTADIVVYVLTLMGNPSYLTTWGVYWDGLTIDPPASFSFLNEAVRETPGVIISGVNEGPFWIVKACTGMQAGAILLSLIMFTKRTNESFFNRKALKTKFQVFIVFYFVLFVSNAIRIAFHLWLVTLGIEFEIAHDALSKPIGFVGTLLFAWIIEKMGVPIIDTFADWLDYTWYRISQLL